MSQITGRFYFKLTDAGNLIGEYSNSATPRSLPESAMRKSTSLAGGFAGEYVSTWFEPNAEKSFAANLVITPKSQPATGLFSLTWTGIGVPDSYQGEAMLCDGVLIGNYRSET